MKKEAYIYALLVVLFWATVASAFKISLRFLNFLQLLFFSSLTASFILLVIGVAQRKLLLIKESFKRYRRDSLILGFLNPFLYYLVLFKAYSLLPAQEAQPLNQTWAIIFAILSSILLKRGWGLKNLIPLLISFSGVLIIITHGNFKSLKFSNPYGVALALGSAFIWAFYWVFNLKDKRDDVVKLFTNFVFGLLFIIPLVFLTGNFNFPCLYGIFGGIYVGIFEMGLTFILWLRALKLSPSTAQISNFIYLVPFFSLIIINQIVGEKISITTPLGLFFIILGILIQEYYCRKM